ASQVIDIARSFTDQRLWDRKECSSGGNDLECSARQRCRRSQPYRLPCRTYSSLRGRYCAARWSSRLLVKDLRTVAGVHLSPMSAAWRQGAGRNVSAKGGNFRRVLRFAAKHSAA